MQEDYSSRFSIKRLASGETYNENSITKCNNTYRSLTGSTSMKEKNYSFKGSPNAGLVLSILAVIGAVAVFLVGFSG